MLITKIENQIHLIPIDHACILPESLDDIYFEWFNWRQAKQPFGLLTLQFIAEIDIETDALILKKLGIQNKSIVYMKLASVLLKKGAAFGLTLFQIASLIVTYHCRRKNEPSQFQKLVEQANHQCQEKISIVEMFEKLVDELFSSKQLLV